MLLLAFGSSVVDNVFGVLSFFLFPFVDVHRSIKPCIIVLQIITLSGIRFFIYHKVIQVVFSSLGWSSCSPLGLCRFDYHRIPLSGFSGPSVWILACDPQCLSPFQFRCMSAFFHQLLSRFFFVYSISSSGLSFWLAVLSSSPSNEILLSWSYQPCVLSSSRVSSLISSSRMSFSPGSFLFLYFLCVWMMMSRSILRCAVRNIFFVFFCCCRYSEEPFNAQRPLM